MAILRYISATAATTPLPPDSPKPPSSISNLRQTKVSLPKTTPEKLATTAAQLDNAVPPTPSKPRKNWLGQGVEPWDSDYSVFDKDFVPRMKRLFDDSDPMSDNFIPEDEDSGFLSLSRAMSLDSMEVDLSKELTAPLQSAMEVQVEAPTERNGVRTKWEPSPTRRELDKWGRARKFATRGSEVMLREGRQQTREDPEVLAAQAREQYFKLKRKMQVLTLAVGGVGLVSSYVSYSPEVAASFGAGFIGSLVYIRMLGTSVDALADGARGLLKGAIAQPRLLVPVVLVMVYNRWNGILVPQYGLMHLDLIPMLVGFFTYKIATFIQTIEEALTFNVKKDGPSSS